MHVAVQTIYCKWRHGWPGYRCHSYGLTLPQVVKPDCSWQHDYPGDLSQALEYITQLAAGGHICL